MNQTRNQDGQPQNTSTVGVPMGIRGPVLRGLRARAKATLVGPSTIGDLIDAGEDLSAIARIEIRGDFVVPGDLYARVIRALRAAGEIECCGEASCLIETVRLGCRQLVDELREACGAEGGGR